MSRNSGSCRVVGLEELLRVVRLARSRERLGDDRGVERARLRLSLLVEPDVVGELARLAHAVHHEIEERQVRSDVVLDRHAGLLEVDGLEDLIASLGFSCATS